MTIRIFQIFFASLLLPCSILAGEIYGNLTEEGRPVGPGVNVEVMFGGKTYSGSTDSYGSYRVHVPDKGRSELRVRHPQMSESIEVFSYEGSVRYDLVLEKKDGKLSLRRK